MSGKDEEPFKDIPVCTKCGEIPEFWILYPTLSREGGGGWIWFHSNKVMLEAPSYIRLHYWHTRGAIVPTIQGTRLVVCRPLSSIKRGHSFTSEHPMFQEVIRYARKFDGER